MPYDTPKPPPLLERMRTDVALQERAAAMRIKYPDRNAAVVIALEELAELGHEPYLVSSYDLGRHLGVGERCARGMRWGGGD